MNILTSKNIMHAITFHASCAICIGSVGESLISDVLHVNLASLDKSMPRQAAISYSLVRWMRF